MRVALFLVLAGLPLQMTAQAPRCEPSRQLVVDTTRVILGVRARLASDSLEDAQLTQSLGGAMGAIPFRVPGTISRSFYPGTGGGPMARADQLPRTRLLARITVDPTGAATRPWRFELETASEDPATDTVFVEALEEAVPWALPAGTTSVTTSWVAELVVAVPGDPTVHPLARLTVPAIRLEQPVRLIRAPAPRFPRDHPDRGRGGVVRLQYVVDEVGRAEPLSVRILSAPSMAFAQSAREVILSAEYTPAIAGGCPQKQLVEQNVRFVISERMVKVQ